MITLGSSVPQVNHTQEPIYCPPQNTDVPCAWCLAEQGIKPEEESHGICTPHAEEQYEKYKASKVVRQ